mgnify:CR=1 FL=1
MSRTHSLSPLTLPASPRLPRFATPPRGLRGLLRLLLCFVAIAGAPHVGADERFDYRLEPVRVADGFYVLIGLTEDFSVSNGGNIVNTGFIVGEDGVIVVDTGPSLRYGQQMLAAIRRITELPVVLTLNTHHHPDHFLGNQAFPPETLAALPETIRGIETEGEGFNENMYRLNRDWMRGTEVVAPSVALTEGRRRVAGRDLEFLALAGHTAADLVVIDHATGTVFASDLLFHDRAPTTPHADIDVWLASLARLESIPATRWIPGHGPVSEDLAPLHQTRDYLQWLATTIHQGASSGMDMAEMLDTPIPERFHALAEVDTEFRRSVIHLFPAAEQAVLEARD